MNLPEAYLHVVLAGGVFLLSVAVGFLARGILLGRLSRLAGRTSSQIDDVLVASLRRPLPLWFALLGLYAAHHLVKLPADIARLVDKAVLSLLIAAVTFWAAAAAGRLLDTRASHDGAATRATGVVKQAARAVILLVGGLVLLGTLGISVTPVLTTLGIGGLAVALGLQETLANLFAGMQVTLAGNVRVGDFIRLESGEEGYVDDIHWRATRIRTLPNNFVLIPNSRLAQSVVTNYHRPSTDMAVLLQVGVHYASDLDHVERVTRQVGAHIMKTVTGSVPDFEPFIRYHTFADSSINFTVILRAQQFTDSFLIKHEFIKELSRAYAKEGIVIPFPIRALNLDQEKVRLERATP